MSRRIFEKTILITPLMLRIGLRPTMEDGIDRMDQNVHRTSSWRYSRKRRKLRQETTKKLMNEDMLPNACSVDCDVFRKAGRMKSKRSSCIGEI